MAVSDLVTQRAFVRAPQRGVATRLLEDERWLAAALLAPTAILLGLFIAYPFAEGVWLSVIDARVGVPGHFVGQRKNVTGGKSRIDKKAGHKTAYEVGSAKRRVRGCLWTACAASSVARAGRAAGRTGPHGARRHSTAGRSRPGSRAALRRRA